MDSFPITVDGTIYTVNTQLQATNLLYILKAGDADIVFCENKEGNIIPRDEAEPVHLLQKIGMEIKSHLLRQRS